MPEQLMLLVWVPAITIVVVVALVDGIARRASSAVSAR
jgi:hypothetical protein